MDKGDSILFLPLLHAHKRTNSEERYSLTLTISHAQKEQENPLVQKKKERRDTDLIHHTPTRTNSEEGREKGF
jgi:ectoine hydroxylase-related dioxygenase (phytanoyl-CoA dioxygenase family)